MTDCSPEAASLVHLVGGAHAWVQPDGSWWINNAGVVVDGGRALVVDTCATEERTRRFLGSFPETVAYAVNTHQHGDHTYGNSLLPDTAVLFGHERMRAGLDADTVIDGCPPLWSPVPDWGAVTKRLPDVTYVDAATIRLGGTTVELHHPGHPAHTPGDTVVWLPEERVLYAGDLLFHGLTPLVLMGSVDGALRSLDWLAGFGAEHVVPGHGPLIDDLPTVLAEHEAYYRYVRSLAAQDIPPAEAPHDLGRFTGWADSERIVPNLHRAYADRDGGEVDVAAAFLDAVTWRGGPMHTAV